MLVPMPYDPAWTDLRDVWDPAISPGDIAANPALAAAAGSAAAVPATPSGAVMAANPRRGCLIIQNNSATGGPVLWFNFGQPAVANAAGSFALQPGSSLVIAEAKAVPKEALFVMWAGTGTAIGAYYQNTLPEAVQTTSTVTGWQENIGAQAWGYSSPPPPPPPPPRLTGAAGFVPLNIA